MAGAARVFTVPPGLAFVDVIAEGMLAEHGASPLGLSAVTLLLPTRRAVRSLREAFLRLSAAPMLLPAMRAVGDVDEDELALGLGGDATLAEALDLPPAISDLERQLLLAQLIRSWESRRGAGGPSAQGQAVRLAGELARFIDQVQTSRLAFDGLEELVTGELAAHWRETLRFLDIVTGAWPRLLASRHAIDPVERRNRMLAALAARWRTAPPAAPVIAAGSTGSIPATADLLAVIARLPQGRVVLPGLDRTLDEDSWQAIGETHPQSGMKRLLERLQIERDEVADWPTGIHTAGANARAALAREVMRPEATCQAWANLGHLEARAVAGLTRIDCADARTEAGVIALLMREALEHRGRTAALVTADRTLARRVRAELARWRITVDDSAGLPLAGTQPGIFLRLCLEALAENLAPVALLSLLKHPLAAGGDSRAAFRASARRLERACLRGPRPGPGFAGLRRALGRKHQDLRAWLKRLEQAATPLARLLRRRSVRLAEIVRAHVGFAEWLAADGEAEGAQRLWAADAGASAAALVEQLIAAGDGLSKLPGNEYPALVEALVARAMVRPRAGAHPRLAIWGPLEARLQHADLVILGGLVEASWPGEVAADPWLSRPMRHAFGLPPPERQVGLAAHDFAQLFCAPRVVLTRAEKIDGTPTVPSRWLTRLETVLKGADLGDRVVAGGEPWLHWQAALDTPAGVRPVPPPAPAPPVAARPRALSVTRIERWMRDPYEIYARYILGLERLEPIDAMLGPAEFGRYIHHALHRFVHETQGPMPDDPLPRLLEIGREAMAEAAAYPGLWAFLWPRFARIGEWFVAAERARRTAGFRSLTEIRGRLQIAGEMPFTVTAIADRIDIAAGGCVDIIDYKTGTVPSDKEIFAGFAPQLPLEAAIAAAGGFRGLAAAGLGTLAHWRLSGGRSVGEIKPVKGDAEALAAAAAAGVAALVATFDEAETAYAARPMPSQAPRYSDYEHLARLGEWSVVEREAR